ncbi:MAG: transcription antitermination factor NusB [Bacillota bacterium]
MKRSQLRELAFQIIFQIDVGQNDPHTALEERFAENPLNPQEKEFCSQLVLGTYAHIAEIDKKIEEYAFEWKVERMLSVDRNLLRLAVYEMLFDSTTPAKVAVNEALELAKIFGSEESPKFINGILGQIIKNHGE